MIIPRECACSLRGESGDKRDSEGLEVKAHEQTCMQRQGFNVSGSNWCWLNASKLASWNPFKTLTNGGNICSRCLVDNSLGHACSASGFRLTAPPAAAAGHHRSMTVMGGAWSCLANRASAAAMRPKQREEGAAAGGQRGQGPRRRMREEMPSYDVVLCVCE